ncbi:ABC transporter permease [Jiangella ureilytica]|uniref:ABC transporter permease n=1 Tax=Jiangella ureilytica TaxID=2530374 RepID=A0A4R4S4J9_9ACTN|nr:ABC transporter permease [Jiangella ureilytica]TDC56954.1 ABC transporter permease [Jiangella ureilytica]
MRAGETLRLLFRGPTALAAAAVLVLLVLTAFLGERLAPYDATGTDVSNRLQGPSADHWFGTDELGRDVLSRVILGAEVSLRVGVVAVGISLVAGVLIGLLAGYYGRWVDDVLMRLSDVLFAFPAMLMAIAVLAILGPGSTNAMIAIGIVYTPIFARITRASVLSVREEVYVKAARSAGAGDLRIIGRHVLPNVTAPIIVQTSISLAFAILSEAALSFVGLGTQPPDPSWGRMLSEGRGFVEQAWWMAVFPGLAIFVTVLAFNVLGDALRDVLDPRQRQAMAGTGVTA